jgi:hypothetical protein
MHTRLQAVMSQAPVVRTPHPTTLRIQEWTILRAERCDMYACVRVMGRLFGGELRC